MVFTELAIGWLLFMRKKPRVAAAGDESSHWAIVNKIADAIAFAEGFYVQGSRPQRNNNPGNLTVDLPGGGQGIGKDGIYIVYDTAADGWADLKVEIELMLTNRSRIYNREMSIVEVAQKYTTTQQFSWAQNVSHRLGVTPHTKLSEIQ
jgi:hypothetical protein